jgi:hypothetical protein
MEDRITPGLYMELGNMDPEAYGTLRAPHLLASPGVQRVTWWENLAPGRDELPMEVDDGAVLGVAEVDETFEMPDALHEFTARRFRRYPRPGQGILSGRPTTGLLVVWISPQTPELTQALRDWGDFVHIRHIAAAALPGFTRITVYENVDDIDPRFLHFYELDCDEPESAYSAMAKLVAQRLGGSRSEEFRHWADYRSAGGRLIYCNTFSLIGASTNTPGTAPSDTTSRSAYEPAS